MAVLLTVPACATVLEISGKRGSQIYSAIGFGGYRVHEARAAALSAARWVESRAVRRNEGLQWPEDSRHPSRFDNALYGGSAGPILFLLETYRYTGEGKFLEAAEKGAGTLLASIDSVNECGLYVGLAGIGFVLGQISLLTRRSKYRKGALEIIELLRRGARATGPGVEWNDETDIISGGAGIGLFLLWAASQLKISVAGKLAALAGHRIIQLGGSRGGRRVAWTTNARLTPETPNFSHGTAGVAYFLATLYQQTGESEFLRSALAGARYLTSIAEPLADGCVVFYSSNNKKLYYAGWCHGPAGTARLFYRLFQITKDDKWMEWTLKMARGSMALGAPMRIVNRGDWLNFSTCCGVAGLTVFFRSMYEVTGDSLFKDLADAGTSQLISSATRDKNGYRWVQSESRRAPGRQRAQTGLMNGASGIGLSLLRASVSGTGRKPRPIVLPDNPFEY